MPSQCARLVTTNASVDKAETTQRRVLTKSASTLQTMGSRPSATCFTAPAAYSTANSCRVLNTSTSPSPSPSPPASCRPPRRLLEPPRPPSWCTRSSRSCSSSCECRSGGGEPEPPRARENVPSWICRLILAPLTPKQKTSSSVGSAPTILTACVASSTSKESVATPSKHSHRTRSCARKLRFGPLRLATTTSGAPSAAKRKSSWLAACANLPVRSTSCTLVALRIRMPQPMDDGSKRMAVSFFDGLLEFGPAAANEFDEKPSKKGARARKRLTQAVVRHSRMRVAFTQGV
mmetsp:Transcript_14610/g.34753  ORF Transcript_14610/g.34753 Transcript_14610/m.34753 type:complete len:291 (+) Transcript_14610:132-1004(+)